MNTILVVEDDGNLLQLYRDELTESGYNVLTAKDGEEALALVRESRPDLVTLDIKLETGGASGIEVLRKIKEIDSTIPVIINTAYGEFKQDFGTWASEDFVVKSSDIDDLKSRISAFLKPKNGT